MLLNFHDASPHLLRRGPCSELGDRSPAAGLWWGMPETTAGLIHEWRAARPGSFAALHERLSPALRVWAELRVPQVLRGRLNPDELVQEVWICAWREFERFDPARGRFRSWLYGIAYNVMRGQLRTLARRRSVLGGADTAPGDIPECATSVLSRVSRGIDFDVLHAELARLDETDRAIVTYRGLEGLPHREVAQRIGLSEEAVEVRWRRLRPRLRGIAQRIGLS